MDADVGQHRMPMPPAIGVQDVAGRVGWSEVVPWAFAALLAAIGTAIDFMALPGINWGIWTTLAAGALLWVAGRRARARDAVAGARPQVDRVAVWSALLAALVSWGAAVTASGLFQFFIFVTSVVLLAVATRVAAGLPGDTVGARAIAASPLIGAGVATLEAGRRTVAALTSARSEPRTALVRGVMLAVPVAAVFALVLAGADPVLSAWRDELWDALARIAIVPRAVFFVGLGVLTLGAYGLAARAPELMARTQPAPARPRLGTTERGIVVGAVAGVFGAFLALQVTYLFRDVQALRVSGMTYAEYAHRGFVELTLAATLAIGFVLVVERYTTSPAAAGAAANRGLLLLLAEVLVVLASAFHRLLLYESGYGYTMLRVDVQGYVIGVAIALLLLADEVRRGAAGFDARRLARRAGVVAIGLLVVFSFGNPERWVVQGNMARYRATGRLDPDYLASLSFDAVPAVVAAMRAMPPGCAENERQLLARRHAWELRGVERLPWYSWNLGRAQGIAALHAAHADQRTGQEKPQPCASTSVADPYYEFGPS